MKKKTIYLTLFCLLLVTTNPLVFAEKTLTDKGVQTAEKEAIDKDYYKAIKKDQIDASSAASKLRANKSHAVSKQDETILTAFLGLLVIAFIVFLAKVMFNKK